MDSHPHSHKPLREDPFRARPRIISYTALRHLAVSPDSTPGHRLRVPLSFHLSGKSEASQAGGLPNDFSGRFLSSSGVLGAQPTVVTDSNSY
jgi:hypothetical protein